MCNLCISCRRYLQAAIMLPSISGGGGHTKSMPGLKSFDPMDQPRTYLIPNVRGWDKNSLVENDCSAGKGSQQPQEEIELEDENELFILEIKKTVNGIGFRVTEQDGKVRISRVFTDHRAACINKNGVLMAEHDILLQIGDTPVSSMDEAKLALASIDLNSMCTIHLLREGRLALTEAEKLVKLEARRRSVAQHEDMAEYSLMEKQKKKFELRTLIRKNAKKPGIMQELVKIFDKCLAMPDPGVMCCVQDAFDDLSQESLSMDLSQIHNLSATHVGALCGLVQKLRTRELRNKTITINLGWREVNRISINALADLLLASTEENNDPNCTIIAHLEAINTAATCAEIVSPKLYGKPFLRKVCKILPKLGGLKSVSLANSYLLDKWSRPLIRSMVLSETLEHVVFTENSLGATFGELLGETLAAGAKKQEESKEDDPPDEFTKAVEEFGARMKTIDLQWNELGSKGATKFFTGLVDSAQTCALVELNLSFNGIGDAIGPPIRKVLETNVLSNLQKLDLSNNRISAKGSADIGLGMCSNTRILEFSLSFNKIGFTATVDFISKIKENKILQVLCVENTCGTYHEEGISGCNVDSEGKNYMYYGDDIVQYLFDLKEHMNIIRAKSNSDPIEVRVEYPYKLRECYSEVRFFYTPLGISNEVVVEKNPLDLTTSVFRTRARESDARAFFDTNIVSDFAMNVDWKFLKPKCQRFIKEEAEIEKLYFIVKRAYFQLTNIYRHYAAVGNDHDAIGFNEFITLVDDCMIPDRYSCPPNAAQGAFVAANVEIEAESKQDEQAMDANDDNSLCVYELIEAIIRLALRKFYDKASKRKAECPTQAVEWILDEHVLLHCPAMESNTFRREKMYFLDVVHVLETYKNKIDKMWRQYAGSSSSNLLMRWDEWMSFTQETQIGKITVQHGARTVPMFSAFTLKHAFWASQTMIKNVLIRNVREKSRNNNDALSYTEFLESLVRIADSITAKGALLQLGLPPENALVSEKLIAVIELFLNANGQSEDAFGNSKFPSLIQGILREEHQQMEWPERDDYMFEDTEEEAL
uniref:PDZ domain-containing protein n=1 Tax=Mucochytrium quahogii TaxID=96639 RepID=A0A7S2WA12_9STRA|mmetsp:Transcript_21033/g.34327  ORF Transcript_21033/g.34327 Transcript_21033/m.34327 type:complete len:1049 (+) Transcript_21033:127-3273(+)